MIRFSKLAAALAVLPVLAVSGPALADSPGQLAGGPNVYLVKNLTQKGSFGSTVSVACNEEVQYSAELHNAANGGLTNVQVSANLSTGKLTATPAEGASQGTSGSVTVNVASNGTLNYENGSTVLNDFNGNTVKALPDGITSGGINVGNVNGSTIEFVDFKAKVSCPTNAPEVKLACVDLSVSKIDRTRYDFTVTGSAQNATITGYTFTVKDSNSKVVDTNTVNTSATSAVYHFNQETGTYTVSAQLNTDHGNATSNSCVKQITVADAPTTPETPKATSLPNTGAGDVVGIFAGASAAGTAAHAIVTRRRR